MALKWRPATKRAIRKQSQMGIGRLFRACVVTLAFLAAVVSARPALAQANFDRPGGDYSARRSSRAIRPIARWSASATGAAGPGASTIRPTSTSGAVCWLKSNVPARVQDNCCVSGVRGAGVVEPRNGAIETSIDRFGGDYRNFELEERRR